MYKVTWVAWDMQRVSFMVVKAANVKNLIALLISDIKPSSISIEVASQ